MVKKMALPALNLIYAAALALQSFCEGQSWKFCFIGGVAVSRWGEQCVTLHADLTLLTGFSGEKRFVDELLIHFSFWRPDGREFGLMHRVLMIEHSNGVPLDVALGSLPFEIASIDRSSRWKASLGCDLQACSAEDLIVHKVFAGHPWDWADLEWVSMRQGAKLDGKLILKELAPLAELKEQPGIVDQLHRLFQKYDVES